jgi:hypothetical protein
MKKHISYQPVPSDSNLTQICAIIQDTGVSDGAAALLAGFSVSALSRWKLEDPEVAFRLEAARAELQRELIAAVREARRRDGSSDWRGAAWLLERLFPETFGRRSKGKSERQEQEPVTAPAPALPKTTTPVANSPDRDPVQISPLKTSESLPPNDGKSITPSSDAPITASKPSAAPNSLFAAKPKAVPAAALAGSILPSAKIVPPDFTTAATTTSRRMAAAGR